MRKERNLKTVAAVVRAFGGKKAIADWAGVGVTAIYNWVNAEDFPTGWHYRLHMEAERRGYHIDPSVFTRRDAKSGRRAA